MTQQQIRIIVNYLQRVVDSDPQVRGRNEGECIDCGAEIDFGRSHEVSCHYREAPRLLKEFTEMLK